MLFNRGIKMKAYKITFRNYVVGTDATERSVTVKGWIRKCVTLRSLQRDKKLIVPPPAESPEEAAGDQESEDDLSASRTSLERQAPHRGNTMVHVCWHRNTSVSMVDFSVAVEVGPGRGRARPTARARRGCCRTAGLGLSPPPG